MKKLILKKYRWLACGIILTLLTIALVSYFWAKTSNTTVIEYVYKQIGQTSSLEVIDNRVNVLLLGIPGGKHDGPNLTDTIMVASYNTKTNHVDLVSLPRDLWLDEHKSKINTLYQLGLKSNKGLDFPQEEIGKILGLKIPYAIKVDFNGFIRAVDMVDGLEVIVPKGFDDYLYPIAGEEDNLCGYAESEVELTPEHAQTLGVTPGKRKVLLDTRGQVATVAAELDNKLRYSDQQVINFFPCRFEHLNFKKGINKLYGETALKFVRSRHGTNGEGSDYARSRRQQIVLQAFKNEVLSSETLTDPQKLIGLVKNFSDHIETNIEVDQYLDLLKLLKQMKGFRSFVIDESGKAPLLVSPRFGNYGAWVLVPSGGNFDKIHNFVQAVFTSSIETTASAEQK